MSRGYFPEPYPDELLYSIVARYGRHVGLDAPGLVTSRLFGTRHATVSVDLPGHLSDLAGSIGDVVGLDPDRIVDRHTLFPYHAAFQPASRWMAARLAMIGHGRSTHFLLGVARSSARRSGQLLFCPQCYDDMLARHAEPYWRRTHQLPGVLVCPDHGCSLRVSLGPSIAPHSSYVAATASTCPADAPAIVPDASSATMGRLVDLARACAALLEEAYVDGRDGRVTSYREKVAALGLMRSERKVDVIALRSGFGTFWGEALGLVGVEPPSEARADWLLELLRVHRTVFPPLRHLLLQRFLDGATRDGLIDRAGPWECLNPLASHRGERIVTDVRSRSHGGVTTGTFTCLCGYAYRRRLAGNDAIGPPTFKVYGPTLEPALRRLLVAGASQRAVATAIGLDVKTMNAQVTALGLTAPWNMRRRVADGHARAPLRELAPSGACPAEEVPVRRDGRCGSPPFNWAGTDEAVANRLSAAAAEILAARPPVRVTPTELDRRLGRKGWLRANAARLPKAGARVAALTETVDAFRKRRILCFVRDADSARLRLAPWEVMRSVGVSSSYLTFIEAAFLIERPLRT